MAEGCRQLHSGPTRAAAALAATAMLAILAFGLFVGRAEGTGSTGSLDLVDQSVDADPTSPWWARLRVSGAAEGTNLVTTVFQAIPDRSAFLAGIEDRDLGGAIARLAPVPLGEVGEVVLVNLDPGARERARMDHPAVHPVRFRLNGADGQVLDELTTYAVVTGEDPPENPLKVTMTMPFGLAPRIDPAGVSQLSPRDELQLQVIVEALDSHRLTPLAVEVTAETLVALQSVDRQSARDLVSSLASALSGREVITRPFVRLQPAAWFPEGMGDAFDDQLAAGAETTAALLGTLPTTGLWMGDATLDADTVEALTAKGFDRFAIPRQAVRHDLFLATGVESDHVAMSADTDLAAHIGSTGDPVLDAHRVLADLAITAIDAEGTPAGAVIAPPDDWTPSDPFLNALLDGLEVGSLIQPASLSSTIDSLPTPSRRIQPAATPPAALANYPERLAEVSAEVAGLEAVLPEATALVQQLSTILLTSGSADLTVFEREAYLSGVSGAVGALTPVVTAQEGRRVTMTDRDGVIPIILENQSGRPVRVAVELRSDKLEFPDGAIFETELTEGFNQLDIAVEARTSGDSILEVEVLSPDRSLELSATSVTVRSTALSGIGLIIAAAALLILLVWWIRNFRSGRRDQRLVTAGTDSSSAAS